MTLASLLESKRMCVNMAAGDKQAAITELVDTAIGSGLLMDRDNTIAMFMERENLGSTGIGLGVAVPHIRLDTIEHCQIVFGRSGSGIGFDAIDNNPVHLFFMIFGPAHEHHQENYLSLMAAISKMLKNHDVRNQLINSASEDELMGLITQHA